MFASIGVDCLYFILYHAILHPEPDPDTFISISLVCKLWSVWCRTQVNKLHSGKHLRELFQPIVHTVFGCKKHSLLVGWCAAYRWKSPSSSTKYNLAFVAKWLHSHPTRQHIPCGNGGWQPLTMKEVTTTRHKNIPAQTQIRHHLCTEVFRFNEQFHSEVCQVDWVITWNPSGRVERIWCDAGFCASKDVKPGVPALMLVAPTAILTPMPAQ